ncbi:MAG TPA: efflux RND transporter periplasmic adaptor subunit [Xanthobacteraceae bacterium]|nr:efflux RND transporter periplasmic adaptor subunit [Xanthobacteraceae bacterium]
MSSDPNRPQSWARALPARVQVLIVVVLVFAAGAGVWVAKSRTNSDVRDPERAALSPSKKGAGVFYPTAAQWSTLTVEPVEQRVFRSEHVTEGKIAVDEDRSTPIFSPYAGRVLKLFVKPGDTVTVGQPLFTVQAADMVQAQNDFISAATALNKARSAQNLAEIIDKRQRLLYEGKAVPLKEVQNARAALDAAENDMRSAEVALEAARNRLRILGKTDQEITEFQDKGTIDPSTLITAPIAGTIVQRKVGPGQYVGSGQTDPVFIIGDLSTVWVVAFIRETEAPLVHVGQQIYFTVLAYPDRAFPATISYVAAALDPSTRRLLVRATVNNADAMLKPEMFASVKILTGQGDNAVAVPRDAIIYEGDSARVWVVREKDDEKAIELRRIKVGLTNGNMVEVLKGLASGDRVVTKGTLFIDRVASSAEPVPKAPP